jgi:hypothetical protein
LNLAPPLSHDCRSSAQLFGNRFADGGSVGHSSAVLDHFRNARGVDAIIFEPLREGEEVTGADRPLRRLT